VLLDGIAAVAVRTVTYLSYCY